MKIAVYAITRQGCELAMQIAAGLDGVGAQNRSDQSDDRVAGSPESHVGNNVPDKSGNYTDLFIPERFAQLTTPGFDCATFASGTFTALIENNWKAYDGHVFVMATGIVVRKIAPLLEHKTKDPAVVVCDEVGGYAISLLSGHIGGANRLTQKVASITGASPVITTGTDVQKLMAFDEMAAIQGWTVTNPEDIKHLNSMLLETRPVAVMIPRELFQKYYSTKKNLFHIDSVEQLQGRSYDGLVVLDSDLPDSIAVPRLFLTS